jgi:hypothetical protein
MLVNNDQLDSFYKIREDMNFDTVIKCVFIINTNKEIDKIHERCTSNVLYCMHDVVESSRLEKTEYIIGQVDDEIVISNTWWQFRFIAKWVEV